MLPRHRNTALITSVVLGAGLILSSCTGDPRSAAQDANSDAAAPAKTSQNADQSPEPVLKAAELDPVSTEPAALTKVEEIGGMRLKIDRSEINVDGLVEQAGAGGIVMFYDPTCESCADLSAGVKAAGHELIRAPVAFYAQNGLELVGREICRLKDQQDPSEDCAVSTAGMTKNTGWLMRHGIVDLPVLVLPNGWLVEGLSGDAQLTELLAQNG